MNLKQTLLTAATGIALLTNPSFGGGPVIVTTEEPPIADVRPQGDGGKWVVPVIVGIGILAIIAGSGGGSDCTCTSPEDGGSGCGCP